jgi:HEAT repeat protein
MSERCRQICFFLLLAFGWATPHSARADGCFVFRWNKAIDINEPTQKAIIVHDAGRQDLLLQVGYEGPLEEFGWLIPVPSLPKVEKGSMEPFYELSALTQRQFGPHKGIATAGLMSSRGVREEAVKVIEIKTVGAYEVAVLSATDSGSLARWLRTHDYSLPEGKSEIVDDYIRRGWYFVAAKIQLNKANGFETVSSTAPSDADALRKARKTVKSRLASGELHPLRISFDTPKAVFPLRISAINGKPSEVSLYVLSPEPLLEKFIFGKACEKLNQRHVEWENQKPQNVKARETSMQNLRSLQLAFQMYALNSTNRNAPGRARTRNWSTEDLTALAEESQPPLPQELLDATFYASPTELLQQMHLLSDRIPRSAKALPRLKKRDWHLTKLVWTFAPDEMHDLEFEPAVPALARVLSEPSGTVAGELLTGLGDDALSRLIAACQSSNSTERIHATRALGGTRKPVPAELLRTLLNDQVPQVRLHAARCADANWDAQFAEPLISLFRDPYFEIRQTATGCLSSHDTTNRTAVYLALLDDPDPNVRMASLGVATWLNRYAARQDVFTGALKLLKDPNEDVQSSASHAIWRMNRDDVPRTDLLPLLNSQRMETINMALNLIEGRGRMQRPGPGGVAPTPDERRRLSSTEAAPLMTHRLGEARFAGLRIMQENDDAKAIELTLPLLRETNSVIRTRAFAVLQTITGQNISDDDAAKWEAWWAANKATFKSR